MWNVGDECNVIAQDGTVVTDCDIREIVPIVQLAMVRHIQTGFESLVSVDDIICIHLRGDIDNLKCPWQLGDIGQLCQMCPNQPDYDINEQL